MQGQNLRIFKTMWSTPRDFLNYNFKRHMDRTKPEYTRQKLVPKQNFSCLYCCTFLVFFFEIKVPPNVLKEFKNRVASIFKYCL